MYLGGLWGGRELEHRTHSTLLNIPSIDNFFTQNPKGPNQQILKSDPTSLEKISAYVSSF